MLCTSCTHRSILPIDIGVHISTLLHQSTCYLRKFHGGDDRVWLRVVINPYNRVFGAFRVSSGIHRSYPVLSHHFRLSVWVPNMAHPGHDRNRRSRVPRDRLEAHQGRGGLRSNARPKFKVEEHQNVRYWRGPALILKVFVMRGPEVLCVRILLHSTI